MILHHSPNAFGDLAELTVEWLGLPAEAVRRDYMIVMALKNLASSTYASTCVFKGGTSLSKCYPNTIERFSEDIDLTFVSDEVLSNKAYDKHLKKIEGIIAGGFNWEKIPAERSQRNKSSFMWLAHASERIKLEIGSTIRPEPTSRRPIKTYIQEFLESHNDEDAITKFQLTKIELPVLAITRTFVDKLFAVKRHALIGSLSQKSRHIYDVVKLYDHHEIRQLLADKKALKDLVQLTKQSDSVYLQKRTMPNEYQPDSPYNFLSWRESFDTRLVRNAYERLHRDLLYTDEPQPFHAAVETFEKLSNCFEAIGE